MHLADVPWVAPVGPLGVSAAGPSAEFDLRLRTALGDTLCHVTVYERPRKRPVVLLADAADSGGPPVASVVGAAVAAARGRLARLREPMWFEASLDRGLAAVLRGSVGRTTVRALDTATDPVSLRPCAARFVAELAGVEWETMRSRLQSAADFGGADLEGPQAVQQDPRGV